MIVRHLIIIVVGLLIAFGLACENIHAEGLELPSNKMAVARQALRQSFLKLRISRDTLLTFLRETPDSNATLKEEKKTILDEAYKDVLPLLENPVLDDTAQQLCESTLSGAIANPDANVTKLFLEEADYKADRLSVGTTGIIMQEYIDPAKGAELLFSSFAKSVWQELREMGHAVFLDNNFSEIGVGYCGGIARLSDSEPVNTYLLVFMLAHAPGPQVQWIQCGHVYFDLNNNNKFDPGEGLSNVLLTDDNGTKLAQTLSNGQFCFRRPKGEWTLFIESFPFVQDYWNYNKLLEYKRDGILWHDYPLLLTQDVIDAHRKLEQADIDVE